MGGKGVVRGGVPLLLEFVVGGYLVPTPSWNCAQMGDKSKLFLHFLSPPPPLPIDFLLLPVS